MKTPVAAYQGHQPFIFVSYDHRDAETVQQYLLRLMQAGFRLWYDEGLEPGSNWPEEIAGAISAAAAILAFVSPYILKNQEERNELNFALTKKKRIVVVYLEPTDLPLGLSMQLSSMIGLYPDHFTGQGKFDDRLFASLPAETRNDAP